MPLAQRLAAGAVGKDCPLALPQAPLTGIAAESHSQMDGVPDGAE